MIRFKALVNCRERRREYTYCNKCRPPKPPQRAPFIVANDLPAQNNTMRQNPERDGYWYRPTLVRTDGGQETIITHGFLFGRCQGAQGDVRVWPTEIAAAPNRERNTGNANLQMTPMADGFLSQKVVARIVQLFPQGSEIFNWYEDLQHKPLGWEDFAVGCLNRPIDGTEIGLKTRIEAKFIGRFFVEEKQKEESLINYMTAYQAGKCTGIYSFNILISNEWRQCGYVGGNTPWRDDQARKEYITRLPGRYADNTTLRGKVQEWVNNQLIEHPDWNPVNQPTLNQVMDYAAAISAITNVNEGLTREGYDIGYEYRPKGYQNYRSGSRGRSPKRKGYYNYELEVNDISKRNHEFQGTISGRQYNN